jgi:PilZ domain
MYCYVEHIDEDFLKQQGTQPRRDGERPVGAQVEKLVHLALPVRLIHMPNGEPGGLEIACTYDIHPRGARLRSSRDLKVGDFVTVERGRMKSICQVVWAADPDSPLRGQFTVECVEGNKIPWEDELRQMEEQYLPVIPDSPYRKQPMNAFRRGEQNRRRRPRFQVDGDANLAEIGGFSRVEGRLEELSELGCLISSGDLLAPGTALRLVLNMCDVSVALRGHVRYTAQNRAMGVEFQEIRQGDRPLLDYVLRKLKKPRVEDFADLEVMTDHLAKRAAAG